MSLLAIAVAGAALVSSPDLGTHEGQCRHGESGPALLIDVAGLKDRTGLLRAEVYPAVDGDFLADDNVLIAAGKTFARVDMPLPATGPVKLCIRLPRSGRYALSLLHDRNGNRKFDPFKDGIGFPGNPALGWSKPGASQAAFHGGAGITEIEIRLNYRRGLSMQPLEDQ